MDDAFFSFFLFFLSIILRFPEAKRKKKKRNKGCCKVFSFLALSQPSSVKRDAFHFSKRLFVSIANEREMAGVPIEY